MPSLERGGLSNLIVAAPFPGYRSRKPEESISILPKWSRTSEGEREHTSPLFPPSSRDCTRDSGSPYLSWSCWLWAWEIMFPSHKGQSRSIDYRFLQPGTRIGPAVYLLLGSHHRSSQHKEGISCFPLPGLLLAIFLIRLVLKSPPSPFM